MGRRVAALFSMVASFFLLRGPRGEAARNIKARLEDSRARRAEKMAGQSQRTDESEEDAETGGR